jgi:hypothetical protein
MIDCMACLVAMAKGLPEGGAHRGVDGVTHSTLRSMGRSAITCTVRRYGRDPTQWSAALATWVPR